MDEMTLVREIYFTNDQAVPRFVYHRNRKLSKLTPPSLKKKPKSKREIDLYEVVNAADAMAVDDTALTCANTHASEGRGRKQASQPASLPQARTARRPRHAERLESRGEFHA